MKAKINRLLGSLKLGKLKPYSTAYGAHYGMWHDDQLVSYISTSVGHVNKNNFKPLVSVDYLASLPEVHGGRAAINALQTVPGATLFTQALESGQAQRFWASNLCTSPVASAYVGLFYIATMNEKNAYTIFDDVTFMSTK